MHRLLLPNAKEIDHIDGNPTNNQRGNLRECTRTQNNANRWKTAKSSSKYKGVSKVGKKWGAWIGYKGKSYALGIYPDQEDAAKIRLQFNYEKTRLEHQQTMPDQIRLRCSGSAASIFPKIFRRFAGDSVGYRRRTSRMMFSYRKRSKYIFFPVPWAEYQPNFL